MSGSRDKTIKLWNTLGECKYTIGEPEGHTEWVSCVRFSPMTNNPIIVSAGWDKLVKVFHLTNCKLKNNLTGHRGYINTVTVSPDGSLCASGGKVRGAGDAWPAARQQRLAGRARHLLSSISRPARWPWIAAWCRQQHARGQSKTTASR